MKKRTFLGYKVLLTIKTLILWIVLMVGGHGKMINIQNKESFTLFILAMVCLISLTVALISPFLKRYLAYSLILLISILSVLATSIYAIYAMFFLAIAMCVFTFKDIRKFEEQNY